MTLEDRLRTEQAILNQDGLSQFEIYVAESGNSYYLLGTHRTNSRRSYDLWIPIPAFYPNLRPPLYIAKPRLVPMFNGRSVNNLGVSHEMHTLSNGPNGEVQICHWRDDRWHPGLTLNKVMLKGLIWLEAYEQHLSSGQSIASFVATMR